VRSEWSPVVICATTTIGLPSPCVADSTPPRARKCTVTSMTCTRKGTP
jgi:hypothetical protein